MLSQKWQQQQQQKELNQCKSCTDSALNTHISALWLSLDGLSLVTFSVHIHEILTLGSVTDISLSAELPEPIEPLSSILYSQRLRSPAAFGPGGPMGPWEPLKPCDPLKPGGPTGPGIFATLLTWDEYGLIILHHKAYVDYK